MAPTSEPIAAYEVHTAGTQVVLQIRDRYGVLWSVGALLSDIAIRHENGEQIISMSVDSALRGAKVVAFKVIERE